MTGCVVSLFRPAKTSVRHDEVSSLSINPVIELRQGRREWHTKVARGLCRSIPPSFLPLSVHIALPKCMSSIVPPPDTHFRFLHFSSQQPSFTCTSHQPKWEPEQTLPERCAAVEGARETSTTACANRPSLVSLPMLQHLYTCFFITHLMPFCGSQGS